MDALIVSNGLDTNGQNARYVRASERWGDNPDVLKALAIGNYDPASVVGRYQAAALKTDTLRIRSVHRQTHLYQQMPADIVWNRHNERDIRALADEADIIHLNNSVVAMQRLRIRRDKGVVLHHHGSLYRSNPPEQLRQARAFRALIAVSTVDLLRYAPEWSHWLPTAYDVDALVELGKAHRREPDGRVRVVQTPTDDPKSNYKSQPALEAAVAALQAEGLPVDLVVVRGKPWAEAMAIKATADVYFDQVKLGYGCNAVEAWGMGIPVIAGADPWTLSKMREVYGSDDLPFYEATEDTIADAIRALVDPVARKAYAKRGMAHTRKFHDERPALARLAELYRRSFDEYFNGPVEWRIPTVTFRATDAPFMRVGGTKIKWDDGTFSTENLHVAHYVRRMALRHPRYGITEVFPDG